MRDVLETGGRVLLEDIVERSVVFGVLERWLEEAKKRPTRAEAIGGVLAAVLGPGSAVAGCLTGPANNLAGILKAIEDKGAGGEAAPAAAG